MRALIWYPPGHANGVAKASLNVIVSPFYRYYRAAVLSYLVVFSRLVAVDPFCFYGAIATLGVGLFIERPSGRAVAAQIARDGFNCLTGIVSGVVHGILH